MGAGVVLALVGYGMYEAFWRVRNADDCILSRVEDATSNAAASAIVHACRGKYPEPAMPRKSSTTSPAARIPEGSHVNWADFEPIASPSVGSPSEEVIPANEIDWSQVELVEAASAPAEAAAEAR